MKGTCEQIPFHFFLKFMMLCRAGSHCGANINVAGGDPLQAENPVNCDVHLTEILFKQRLWEKVCK